MITVKATAHFTVFRTELLIILPRVESIYTLHNVPCEITCGTNGHPSDDPHTHGFAYDFGTHSIPQPQLKPMHEALVTQLGSDYTVLYSDKNLAEAVYVDTPNAHFHIQLRKDLWHKIFDQETM